MKLYDEVGLPVRSYKKISFLASQFTKFCVFPIFGRGNNILCFLCVPTLVPIRKGVTPLAIDMFIYVFNQKYGDWFFVSPSRISAKIYILYKMLSYYDIFVCTHMMLAHIDIRPFKIIYYHQKASFDFSKFKSKIEKCPFLEMQMK